MYTVIRKAEPDDAKFICVLHQESWSEVFDRQYSYPENGLQKWQEVIKDPSAFTYVATIGDVVVGYIHVAKKPGASEITDLYVTPTARRKGLAKELIKEVLSSAASITLWVAKMNRSAIALYESLGFKATGLSKSEPRRADGSDLIEMALV